MRVGANIEEIIKVSDALVAELVAPPRAAGGVCYVCRTWLPISLPSLGFTNECENCLEVREALGIAPFPLGVISLYSKPSLLRDWLTRYKGREGEDDPFDSTCVDKVRSMLGRFFIEHGARLQAMVGDIENIVVVPSTNRPPPHPLEGVVASLDLDVPVVGLLARGSAELGFRNPHRDGYEVVQQLTPRRLLLIDDVYTTGARLNSAACALAGGGHEVVACLVLARRINPKYTAEAAQMWDAAKSVTFDWRNSPWIPQ